MCGIDRLQLAEVAAFEAVRAAARCIRDHAENPRDSAMMAFMVEVAMDKAYHALSVMGGMDICSERKM